MQHIDRKGSAGPSKEEVFTLLLSIRSALLEIDDRFPTGSAISSEEAKALFVSVYGQTLSDLFYATLDDRPDLTFGIDYLHPTDTLETAILQIDEKISYDSFQNRLFYQGIMKNQTRLDFQAVPGVAPAFITAVDNLFNQGQTKLNEVFSIYPEIEALYNQTQTFETVVQQNIQP